MDESLSIVEYVVLIILTINMAISKFNITQSQCSLMKINKYKCARLFFKMKARRAGSDGSMSASGLAGLGFDPWRGRKF